MAQYEGRNIISMNVSTLNLLWPAVALLLAVLCMNAQPAQAFAPDFGDLLPTTNVTYETNYTYTPAPIIKSFHAVPHIYAGLVISNPVFSYSPLNETRAEDLYFQSLLPFPAIIFSIWIAAIICLELGIDDYFSWLVPRLGPSKVEDEDEAICAIALFTHKNEVARKTWLTYFCVALGVTAVGTNLMWYGNAMFVKGYHGFSTEMELLAGKLFGMTENVVALNTDLDKSRQAALDASTANCPLVLNVMPYFQDLTEQIALFAAELRVMSVFTDEAHDEINGVVDNKDFVLYTFYAFSMVMLALFFAAYWTVDSKVMRGVIVTSEVVMVFLAVLTAFEFLIMMTTSDFCMNPTLNAVNALDGLGTIQQEAKYYSLCHGLNPIHRSLANSYAVRDQVGTRLDRLFNPAYGVNALCISDPDIIKSFRSLQHMYSIYESLSDQMECAPIHQNWKNIFEQALCEDTMQGTLILWVSGLLMAVGLFFVAITASVLMLYFDEHWHLEHDMQVKVDGIRDKESHALLGDSETGDSDAGEVLSRTASGANLTA